MSFPARSGSTVAEIDLAALVHNLAELRRAAGGKAGVLAAVKADAYGHGAVEVARALEAHGVDQLGVARVEEGIELRVGGVRAPILVLSGVPVGGPPPFETLEERLDEMLRHRLTPVLYDLEVARALDGLLRARTGPDGRPASLDYHLKVDTGMGRIGIGLDALGAAAGALQSLPRLRMTGAFTHLAEAESPSADARAFTAGQIRRFREAGDALRAAAGRPILLHAGNSAATIRGMTGELDLVRPGIALYGAYPHESDRERISLEPVMRLSTRILFVKEVPAGTPVSYARTFITARPSRIATLPVGYGDGFPRALSGKGEVLIAGKRAPVLGRVCMDLTMVDVTEIPEARAGSEAVLIGEQAAPGSPAGSPARITAEEVAERAGTVSYEILTSVSKRVPRVYRGGA